MNALVYVDIDQGVHKGKLKVARNEKRKKLSKFSFSTNIANFEAFCWTKKLISKLFFLKSECPYSQIWLLWSVIAEGDLSKDPLQFEFDLGELVPFGPKMHQE